MCHHISNVGLLDVASYCAVVWLYGCHDFICMMMMMMIMTVAANQFYDLCSLHEPRLHLVCVCVYGQCHACLVAPIVQAGILYFSY